MLKVYIGWDDRESQSWERAHRSLMRHASIPVCVTPLRLDNLASSGLLRRPMDRRGGGIYDLPSNAPASTEFAISRFLTPILAQSGLALFVDADVVFMGDVAELFQFTGAAVRVVKHGALLETGFKMDGQKQLAYRRKNWSSVMLFDCDHPANRRLSLQDVSERRGFDLHQFYWLADSEIGALPPEWNWLVGVQPKPAHPKLAHFTLGTPELGVRNEHSHIWDSA